ncbi:hypothetical protein PP460_gp206 [Streptomyces phage Muntaha]|uniref:Uncharacterized protein n=1 Tax=Streptomyces phage Muntaha TaxID=2713269 RepID=A0A6G8R3R2_9CAUD|nr:hypothetical protein PP460_gp206 [Streptomyces phage Muntaha]QIN94598.1 hypothetical protein SEA_MUNTAHA_41 [Streptomyces phage Muntaha]
MSNEIKKLEYKIQSLKERFAKKVADYEDEIADIRADATLMFEALNAQLEEERNKNVQDVSQED